jgi:hypothetical protein
VEDIKDPGQQLRAFYNVHAALKEHMEHRSKELIKERDTKVLKQPFNQKPIHDLSKIL